MEELLVWVERNPGPTQWEGQGLYEQLTPEMGHWIFNATQWTAKDGTYNSYVKSLLKYFKPGSMGYQRVIGEATKALTIDGEPAPATEGTLPKWDRLVAALKALIPRTPLTKQDYLIRMKKRKGETWVDFLDRYSLFAASCTQVTTQVQAAELYRKLPKELRAAVMHLPSNATLQQLFDTLHMVRYWQHCATDTSYFHDPMEVDVHSDQIQCSLRDGSSSRDYLKQQEEELEIGEGRMRRPVLNGNSINFRNIDGPRSLMTAWKKLVGTSVSLRHEA